MTEAVAVPTIVVTLAVGLMGYLLRELHSAVKQGFGEMKQDLAVLAAKGQTHSEGLVDLRARVATLEKAQDRLERTTAALMRSSLAEPSP